MLADYFCVGNIVLIVSHKFLFIIRRLRQEVSKSQTISKFQVHTMTSIKESNVAIRECFQSWHHKC